MPQTPALNKWLYLFLGLAVAVNFSGLFVPLMNPDATLYATIAKTMVLRNDYVNIYVRGIDWLDKPHFPFWIAAFFFKMFGINTWAYKLSGIVFMLMGAVYTWLFAKSLYNKQVAIWAVLILLTAQHIVLSDNDVRAEPYLTGLIIASVYHFYRSYTKPSFWHLLIACLFAGCAVMTKGIFVLITIGGAIAGHLIITKQWKQLFNLRWLLAAVLIFIFILPEVYCLYVQFDAHPEKLVFGQHNVSGIKFFFWDSQFGRFFNTGPIKGSGDPFFFVHTTLWAFLPWSLLLFAAIYQFIKKGVKNVQSTEWFNICGAMLTFVMFSASKFQLPHYINIVFPFFAIITAQYIFNVKSVKSVKAINITQWIVIALLVMVLIVLHLYYQPEVSIALLFTLVLTLLLTLFILPVRIAGNYWYERMGYRSIITCVVVNLYLNWAFYPDLLKYQAGSEAGMYVNKMKDLKRIPLLQCGDDVNFAMEFYLDRPMLTIPADGSVKLPDNVFMLYAPADVVNAVLNGRKLQILKEFERYAITRLKPSFLNKTTRSGQTTRMELVLVEAVR
ncbi:glycosyltransferase family 39 protein [Mucilaginibacter sp. UR6-1]|uniref:ArnT family glycosyltransferase n=1 Tax=Mucilaginibacter sp. UR6-1 TaxID=1435643 RepID=UPI001E460B77|nr:glycosyltransferase family 39 protein [Mucilaginibacter sp. UR6-1]MCC8408867.1 glycosyltransferase family 39 protein [Mucilaginibacter sp. UR6-1]